ncbi:hypothetical protein GCM10010182_53130 [Actinomadura cremea]|nr:hypothetical protein GCM10010182_53130 [Actinomadura cremea]
MINTTGPDENTLVMPDGWPDARHPRRDRPEVPSPPALDETAAERVRAHVDAVRDGVEAVLASPGAAADVAAAALAHLGGEPDPLGAVAVGLVAAQLDGSDAAAGRPSGPQFIDALIVEHGPAFAAHALVELGGIVYTSPQHRDVYPPGHRRPQQTFAPWAFDRNTARSVRARLAAAPDDVYAEAVDRISGVRRHDLQRAIAAYLVPTREDWVEDVCANPGHLVSSFFGVPWLLYCAVGRPHQVAEIERLRGHALDQDVVATLLEAVGPEPVVPLLTELLDDPTVGDGLPLAALAALPVDAAFQALTARLRRPEAVTALRTAVQRFPARAVRLLSASSSPLAADILAAHVRQVPAVAEEVARDLPPARRAAVRTILDRRPPTADLPPLLAEPPWTRPREKPKPVVIRDLPAPGVRAVEWAPGERDAWLARVPAAWHERDFDYAGAAAAFPPGSYPLPSWAMLFATGPEDLLRPLMAGWEPENQWQADVWLPALVARLELDARDPALSLARRNAPAYGQYVLPLRTDEIARTMADWLVRRKAAGKTARAWFRRHGTAAAPSLVPDALGKAGAARRGAEAALRLIAGRHGAAPIVEAARELGGPLHGDRAAAAIEALLAADPLDDLPAKMPDVAWVDPGVLPQILLRDRARALPDDAVRHVATMLAMSQPGAEYAGVQAVRELCDPASLAEFGWALFRRWEFGGAPSADKWALAQLALTGDDETVRRLAPVIRAWPGDGGHAKAVVGLDVLTGIGTDTALIHLNAIAQRVKYQGLKGRAQEKIQELATELELTAEQLADRLVPDFGLDADGTLTLGYGPRRFTIALDDQLRPTIADGNGKPRKSLPKPGAGDDPDLAPAAHKRFSSFKKDLRTVASDQLARFEQAMLTGRRWTPDEFAEHLVRHPLVRNVVGRLVWLAEDAGAFRVAEDGTYADVDDDTVTLPATARIRVAHPVHLGNEVKRWSEVFADYEILQPFPQLQRAVHTLTGEERETGRLARFEGVWVPAGALLGLVRRGWERGAPMDAGIEQEFYHPGPGCGVHIDLDPGISVGDPEDQVFRSVRLTSTRDLDPVVVSEVLADLARVTAPTDGTER